MGIVQVVATIAISFAVGVILILLRDQLKGVSALLISLTLKSVFRTIAFDNISVHPENVKDEKKAS